MFLKKFHIYFAKVVDEDGFTKKRPVIVLAYHRGRALCFKVTSQFHGKPYHIRHNYCKLNDWKRENLSKPSYADLNSTVMIPKRAFKDRFGYLSTYDLKKVINFGLERF